MTTFGQRWTVANRRRGMRRLRGARRPTFRRPSTRSGRLAAVGGLLALASAPPTAAASAQAAAPHLESDPEAEVRAAVSETLEAWSAGDFERLAAHYHTKVRGFFLQGAPLARGFNAAALDMAYEAGLRAEVSVRDLDVQVHDATAASVAYVDGTLHLPGDQPPVSGTWRYSEVRVREDGAWKIVQYHFSRLDSPPPG